MHAFQTIFNFTHWNTGSLIGLNNWERFYKESVVESGVGRRCLAGDIKLVVLIFGNANRFLWQAILFRVDQLIDPSRFPNLVVEALSRYFVSPPTHIDIQPVHSLECKSLDYLF